MICYICGESEFSTRKGRVRDAPDLNILECMNCGLVSLDSQSHIRPGHYENSGMHSGDVQSMEKWLRETETDDQRRFGMLRASLANSRLLDFGCGAGGFLRKAQELAARVTGIEPERRVHDYWSGKLEILPTLQDVGDDYDLITAFHVLEHLPDPRAILRELAQHLSARGRIIVEVPSATDALLTLYDCDAFQRFTYWSQHLYLFNTETLRRLAQQAGLDVVSVCQHQRYPLSNHVHWLSRSLPGGHKHWSFLDSPELTTAYASALAAAGRCDTLIAYLGRPQN